jgi:very-short-patch-repair endonuclease
VQAGSPITMETISTLIIFGLLYFIYYVLSSISFHFSEKKVDKEFIREKLKIDTERKRIESKRNLANVSIPNTVVGTYPILLLPAEVEVQRYIGKVNISRPVFRIQENEYLDIYGASEKFFERFLIKYFGNEKISNNANKITVNRQSYIPDFTFIDKANRIFVDIEIDEPYANKTQEPIHCIGMDRERNFALKSGGWAVIRFSEFQIVSQPECCCKFIASYLRYAYADNTIYIELNKFAEIEPYKRWNQEVALNLIQENYRNKYLNKFLLADFHLNIEKTSTTKLIIEENPLQTVTIDQSDNIIIRDATDIEIKNLLDDIVTIYQSYYYRFKELRQSGWDDSNLSWLLQNNRKLGERIVIIKYNHESKLRIERIKFSIKELLENKWDEIQIINFAVTEYVSNIQNESR